MPITNFEVKENDAIVPLFRTYPNGQIWYKGKLKGGMLHGYYEEYRNDGTLVIRGNYVSGFRDGVFEFGNARTGKIRQQTFSASYERRKWIGLIHKMMLSESYSTAQAAKKERLRNKL